MARTRSPDRGKAEKLYIESNGKIKLKEIAETLGLPEGTIRGWKNKDKWEQKLNGTFQKERIKDTERSKRKIGGQPNNKNAVGHGAPVENKNAEKHGFFSKYLPNETLGIIQEIETKKPLDMLWDQIIIQYAAIIRAQKIMYVKSKSEMIKELKKKKEVFLESTEKEWDSQFTWDRQATFLNAQSRAIVELRNLIKQYDEMLNAN